MAEGDRSRETTRSRFTLGDVTNQIGGRQSETNEVKKSFGFLLSGDEGHKRLRISTAIKGGSGSENRDPNIHKGKNCVDPPSTNDARGTGDVSLLKICKEAEGKVGSSKEDKIMNMEVVNDSCPNVQKNEKHSDCEANKNRCHEIDNHDADAMVLSQSGSMDCTFLHGSQESRVIGTDVPDAKLKKVDEGTPTDIKSCSCSFCSKAALLWLDVNQHDIRGRASAIKNSQREASLLARKFINKEIAVTNGDQTISEMEVHLMHQWKSLFQRTADVLEQESKELEASLGPLCELRNIYKKTRS